MLTNTGPAAFLDAVASSLRDPDSRRLIGALEQHIKRAHKRVAELLMLPGESEVQSRERINKDQQNSLHRAFPEDYRKWMGGGTLPQTTVR
jgi:hypothetical protein